MSLTKLAVIVRLVLNKQTKKNGQKNPFQEVGPLDRSVYCSGQQCAEDFSRLIFAPFVPNLVQARVTCG